MQYEYKTGPLMFSNVSCTVYVWNLVPKSTKFKSVDEPEYSRKFEFCFQNFILAFKIFKTLQRLALLF